MASEGVERRFRDVLFPANLDDRFLALGRFLQNGNDLLVRKLPCFDLVPPVFFGVGTKEPAGSHQGVQTTVMDTL